MERFKLNSSSQRESILLGHNTRDTDNLQIRRPSTNPSTSSEVDFNDVFGGPPRRSSAVSSEGVSGEEGEEKPVFGGEDSGGGSSNSRRRYYTTSRNGDFYDDIFGGGEEGRSACSTPKRRDSGGDAFASGAAVLSPAVEALPSSSLPPAFSLPAKLTKGVDLRRLGSPTSRKPVDINDGITASSPLASPDSHLSRMKNDSKPSYRQSILSQELSNLSKFDNKADKGTSNLKQETSFSEVSPNTFHFSIYKWASKGVVPLVMPLRTERISRMKDKVKLERCSSTDEWVVSEITTQNEEYTPVTNNGSENRKQDVSTTSAADSHQIMEEIVSAKAQSDKLSRAQTIFRDVSGSSISCDPRAESSTHSMREMDFNGKVEAASGIQKLGSKSLHFVINQSEDYDEMTKREREENMTKSTKKLSSTFDVTMSPKKPFRKSISSRDGGHSKANSQVSSSLGEKMGKGRVKGKVKEFVQIFNQEPVIKPRVDSKSQSTTYKQSRASRTKNNVEDDPEQSTVEKTATETTNVSANNLSQQQDDFPASAVPDMSFDVMGDKDESFHEDFTIQVLDQDEGEALQNQEKQELQVIDKKVQQWSKGKEGNIRSLLSTLQHVLWTGCGWKPVPLVDIIEGNSVKRSYQRALLCLHPDKLQQKGATSDQKYMAEKVFDILQEAWTQFNMVGAL